MKIIQAVCLFFLIGYTAGSLDMGKNATAVGKTAYAQRAASAPNIDGKLDDAIWKSAKPMTGWVTMQTPHRALKHERTTWVAWDEKNLYVAIRVSGVDTELLEARGDQPELGDTIRLDMNGCVTGIDCEGNNLNILIPYRLPIESKAVTGKKEWTAELAIPWQHLRDRPESGQAVAFNLSGHDYEDGFVSWSPVANSSDTTKFGKLILEP